MATSETKIVVLAVHGNVLVVPLAELLDGGLDGLYPSGFAHGLGAVVGVATSTVPVTLERLGVEGNLDTPLLRNANKEVAGHPEVVTHGDALTRTHLEFPLRGHNLSVDTADVDTGVEASSIMCLDEVTSEHFAGA